MNKARASFGTSAAPSVKGILQGLFDKLVSQHSRQILQDAEAFEALAEQLQDRISAGTIKLMEGISVLEIDDNTGNVLLVLFISYFY